MRQDVLTTLNAPPREDGRANHDQQSRSASGAQRHRQRAGADILRRGLPQKTSARATRAWREATEVNYKDRAPNLTRAEDTAAQRRGSAVKRCPRDADLLDWRVAGRQVGVESSRHHEADPKVLAETSNLLFQAQSASAKTRVALQHPDWDDKAIEEEASAILAEFGATVPDPTSFRPGVDDQP